MSCQKRTGLATGRTRPVGTDNKEYNLEFYKMYGYNAGAPHEIPVPFRLRFMCSLVNILPYIDRPNKTAAFWSTTASLVGF